MDRLTELRRAQGHLLTLRELRYADTGRIDGLAAETTSDIASFAGRAMVFLSREDAFAPHHEEVGQLTEEAAAITTVAGAAPLADRLDAQTEGLSSVTEIVAGLDTGDATVRTSILERIAEVLGGANRARATLDARRRELLAQEGRAAFAAESALLAQTVTGALAAADTPDACDEQLSRLLLRLEHLESRFADHDPFLTELAAQRSEVYEAFSARKQTLQDDRARRAERLAGVAARVLETVTRRASTLADTDAVSTFFASDPMVAKVRRTADELRELGERTRAEELDGRLKAAGQEAARALRDRRELYADGGRTVRLGRHRFAVNTQPLDLTLVPQGDGLAFALTGTDYRSPVTDPDFAATRPYWGQSLPSENADVYRAEYLAVRLLTEHGPAALAGADLPALVRQAAGAAYDEGYERGVHDHDATAILTVLLRLHEGAGLLRYPSRARAEAQLFWAHRTTGPEREAWTRRAGSSPGSGRPSGPPRRSPRSRRSSPEPSTAARRPPSTSSRNWPPLAGSSPARPPGSSSTRSAGRWGPPPTTRTSPPSTCRRTGAGSSRPGSPPSSARPASRSTPATSRRRSPSSSARTCAGTSRTPP